MIPLLLTATINPNGMEGSMFSVAERADMYERALAFYVAELSKCADGGCIVVAENSDSQLPLPPCPPNVSIEYLNVPSVNFDITRGKGYNEVLLISKAIERSEALRKAGCFFKITGRLQLLNVRRMLAECESKRKKGALHFLADCKDHSLYEKMHIKVWGHVGECRYWFAENGFFEQYIGSQYQWLNDYVIPTRLAEDLMLKVCRQTRNQQGCFDRFRTQAILMGTGGHNTGQGSSFFHSTNYSSWQLRLKCFIRQLLRWIAPSLRV